MITVELYGRTGNNMFQIAAAISAAARNNTTAGYVGDSSHLNGFSLEGISKSKKNANRIYQEQSFRYDKKFNNIIDNTHLDGYFQSEKYFLSVEDKVRKCFSFNKDIVDTSLNYDDSKYKKIISGSVSTAVHVRRTDYLRFPDVYPQFSPKYYSRCINRIENKGDILVFSDDLNWCRNNFSGMGYYFIDLPPLPSMYLMSHCKNIIIANSTFSWWAAWLGKPEKVIYPKNWFGEKWPHKDKCSDEKECIKDLIKPGWIGE